MLVAISHITGQKISWEISWRVTLERQKYRKFIHGKEKEKNFFFQRIKKRKEKKGLLPRIPLLMAMKNKKN
jgi:hypothetical protein